MNQSNSSKQVLLSVIGVAILVVAVVGVSFAFFNYTRTGDVNRIQTGQIYFTSSQDAPISITNFFPTPTNGTTPTNSSSAVITITGGTSYEAGMDYRLTAVDFTGTQQTGVPIQVTVAASSTLTSNDNTFTPVTDGTLVSNNLNLGNGFIKATDGTAANRVTGTVTVTASIPANVAISDTYNSNGVTSDLNGTTSAWVNERTVISTETWNSLATNPITFKIRVEAIQHGGTYAYTY